MPASPPSLFFVSLLLLSSTLSHSFFFSNYDAVVLLSHSLARVANLRAARGDLEGEARARTLACNIVPGLAIYKFAWDVGSDYKKNYTWRDTVSFKTGGGLLSVLNELSQASGELNPLAGLLSDLNELSQAFGELNRTNSNAERVAWVSRHYKLALRVSNSLAQLLKKFPQTGPGSLWGVVAWQGPGSLWGVVAMLQKEVVDGELLRDFLELGAGDLKGLIQVLKDIALQYSSSSPKTDCECYFLKFYKRVNIHVLFSSFSLSHLIGIDK